MANQFRYVRGDTKSLSLPTLTQDAIEIGDLVFWDAENSAVRSATNVPWPDYADQKANFAAAFVGVAMEAKAALVGADILVATAGDFLFACPSGDFYEPLDTVAVGNGVSIADQTVVKDTVPKNIIGRVLTVKPSTQATVLVRILSKANALSSEESSEEQYECLYVGGNIPDAAKGEYLLFYTSPQTWWRKSTNPAYDIRPINDQWCICCDSDPLWSRNDSSPLGEYQPVSGSGSTGTAIVSTDCG